MPQSQKSSKLASEWPYCVILKLNISRCVYVVFVNMVCWCVFWTVDEFSHTHLTPRWDLSYDERLKPAAIPTDTPPDSYDWRDHGAVTPVKNQVEIKT